MNLNDNLLLIAMAIGLAISALFAWVIGRTAKSKGFKFGWFFVFGLLSYLIASVVTIFLRPKGQAAARPKLSSVLLLIAGIVVEFTGLLGLPAMENSEQLDSALALGAEAFLGSIFIAVAGVLIIIGAVANDYRAVGKEEVRQL